MMFDKKYYLINGIQVIETYTIPDNYYGQVFFSFEEAKNYTKIRSNDYWYSLIQEKKLEKQFNDYLGYEVKNLDDGMYNFSVNPIKKVDVSDKIYMFLLGLK